MTMVLLAAGLAAYWLGVGIERTRAEYRLAEIAYAFGSIVSAAVVGFVLLMSLFW